MIHRARLAAPLALALALAGCAGSARVDSRKREGYDRKLDRVLIVFSPGRLSDALAEAIRAQLTAELEVRHVKTRFAATAAALSLEEGPSLDKQAKDFGASSILALVPAGGTVNQYGGIVNAKFDGKLLDLGLKKLVWRAEIGFSPGGTIVPAEQRAEVLVRELVTALVADALVSGPPPKAPAAGSEPAANETR